MTEDPSRWLDDPTLSASLRADLAHGASATVTGLDTSAGLVALRGAIAAQTGALAPAAVSTSFGVKALVGVLAVGGALGIWKATQSDDARVEPVSVAPASVEPREPITEVTPPAIPHEAPSLEPVVVADPETEIEIDDDAPVATKRDDRSDRRKDASMGAVKPEPVTETTDDKYLQEAMLVARARKSLAYDAKATLQLTEQIATEFPRGQLVEERRALAIRALAKLGRLDEAKRRAADFLAAHAKGPHAAAVRRAIGESK